MSGILAVEDDALFGDLLVDTLNARGHNAVRVDTLGAAREALAVRSFDALLVDLCLPDGRGLDLIAELRDAGRLPLSICLTAAADVPVVVEAMRAGADDYIAKTDPPEVMVARIERRLKSVGERARAAGTSAKSLADELSSPVPAMRSVRRLASLAADTGTTVLLSGETGTGKSHLARLIHQYSARADRPFITVDCAALSESLVESELFGHERGSFTGAVQRHVGAIESARDGTLFFDEIADLPLSTQGKLLRILEERVVRRIGGEREIAIRARVIGATRRDLKRMVLDGAFREDLYFRLTVLEISVPALRHRAEDVGALFDRFLASHGLGPLAAHDLLRRALASHSFPGNVRELRNIAERYALLARAGNGVVMVEDLGLASDAHAMVREVGTRVVRGNAPVDALEAAEPTDEIGRALVACRGRLSDAARALGMSRHALRRRLQKLHAESLARGAGPEPA